MTQLQFKIKGFEIRFLEYLEGYKWGFIKYILRLISEIIKFLSKAKYYEIQTCCVKYLEFIFD